MVAQLADHGSVDEAIVAETVVEPDRWREQPGHSENHRAEHECRVGGPFADPAPRAAKGRDRIRWSPTGDQSAKRRARTHSADVRKTSDEREHAHSKERILERRRPVLRRDEVLAGGERERDVARRDHERWDLAAVDGHVPVRVIRHLQHHRRIGRAACENVVPPVLRTLVRDRRPRAVGDRNGEIDRPGVAVGIPREFPGRGGTAAKPRSRTLEPVCLGGGRLAPRNRRVFRVAAPGRAIQHVLGRGDDRHQTRGEPDRGRRDDVLDVEEAVVGGVQIVEVKEQVGVERGAAVRRRDGVDAIERQHVVEARRAEWDPEVKTVAPVVAKARVRATR